MTQANARAAQRIEAFTVTMERLCRYMRDEADGSFRNTMNTAKINAALDALDVVEAKLDIFHTKIAEAAATSTDMDVVYRGGGGNGK